MKGSLILFNVLLPAFAMWLPLSITPIYDTESLSTSLTSYWDSLRSFRSLVIESLGTQRCTPEEDPQAPEEIEFNEWLEDQYSFCLNGILSNIGGVSSKLDPSEVHEGVVVASPSKESPDYFYQWVRDAALTIRTLLYYLDDSKFTRENIRNVIENYIENNYHLQRIPNNSGTFEDEGKSGLGEPKFNTDSTSFNKNWGRPQSDGPALRVSTIALYMKLLDKYSMQINSTLLADEYFVYSNIIKPDLIYILNFWDQKSFDLWEEIDSFHFFTSLSQLRALSDGIKLADKHEEDTTFSNSLKSSFVQLRIFIEFEAGFQVPSLPHVIETPSLLRDGKRTGLDAAILLASLHSHNIEFPYPEIPFDVNDNHILNSLSAMVSDMKIRYPINHKNLGKHGIGAALGRYPEDIYDGVGTSEGNPWFIATASAAEVVYKMLYKLMTTKSNIIINNENIDFFRNFLDFQTTSKVDNMVFTYGTATYKVLVQSMFDFSDSFLQIIREHCDKSGRMSEQFNKYDGIMQGAKDLTWSYSSLWNAIRWRKNTLSEIEDLIG